MVKKGDSINSPSASAGKSHKIYLDNLTSSDDSQVFESSKPSKSMKKHGLDQLKRRQVVKKRLQSNANSSKALNKFKLEKMVYMEKNTELAIELEKQKQFVHLKESEILDLKREQFETKEYVIQLENELDDLRQQKKTHAQGFEDIDLKAAAELCNQLLELGATLKKALTSSSSGRHSAVSMNNSTMSRVSTSIDNSKLVSPMETTVMESMNRMQQMANENGNQLLRKQNRVAEAQVQDKMMVYDFEPDDDSDELNAKLEEELIQQQQQQMECDNQMLAIIQEEDEEEEEEEEEEGDNDEDDEEESEEDDEIYEDAGEVEFDEDEIDDHEILEEIQDEESVDENKDEDEDDEGEEESKEEDWVSNNGNKKAVMQTYENKLKKTVSFEFLDTPPPRKHSGNEFAIYNDSHDVAEMMKPKKVTTYEERDNRPLIAHFDLDEKPKRTNLTPKLMKQKKPILKPRENEQQQEEKTAAEARAAEEAEAAKVRKRSIKKSLDRRRSQAFSPLDSPHDPVASENDHTPHIQPIEIFTDAVISPQIVESTARKSILKNNAEKQKKHEEEKPIFHRHEEAVEEKAEGEPVKSIIKRQNSKSKLKLVPQEPVAVESVATTEVEKENRPVEENEHAVKSLIKRRNSKTKLKPQEPAVEAAESMMEIVPVENETSLTEENEPVVKSLIKRRNSKTKLKPQEPVVEAAAAIVETVEKETSPVEENEPAVRSVMKRQNSKTKLKTQESVVETASNDHVDTDKENEVQHKPVKTLVKSNSRTKLKLIDSVDEDGKDAEAESIKTTSLRKVNSKSKLQKPENTETEAVVEFKPPPMPNSKKPPLPKKPVKMEEPQQPQNPNETYVVEPTSDAVSNHNTRVLTEVSQKLDIVAKHSPNHKHLNKRDLKEAYEHAYNENTDPFSSTNTSISNQHDFHLRSADSSINNSNDDQSGDASGRTKRAKKAVSYKEQSLNCKMRRDGSNNILIRKKDLN